jgi:inward rectifier potassium channel
MSDPKPAANVSPLHGMSNASTTQPVGPRRREGLVVTRGLARKPWRDLYPFLLSTTWPRLVAMIVAAYLAVNALFGLLFWVDPGGIENTRPGSFADAFYFSVQTWGTIGYGRMAPISTWAHAVVTVESIASMLSLAMITGLIFSKFSRPTARVLFSQPAVITTWDGKRSLVFRLANERGTQIVDARIHVTLNRLETTLDGGVIRRTHDLGLLRDNNPNFIFAWTVVHPIDERSPLHGQSLEALQSSDTFIGASMTGVDEIFAQTVYARHRYVAADLRLGHDFVSILSFTPEGGRVIDYTHFHDTEPEELDEAG